MLRTGSVAHRSCLGAGRLNSSTVILWLFALPLQLGTRTRSIRRWSSCPLIPSERPTTMSSSTPLQGSALTTIFTPPAGCFNGGLSTGHNCGSATDEHAYETVSCYWSRPSHCYPPSADVVFWRGRNGTSSAAFSPYRYDSSFTFGQVLGGRYQYSPGVLPRGFTTGWTYLVSSDEMITTTVAGCPSYVPAAEWKSNTELTNTVDGPFSEPAPGAHQRSLENMSSVAYPQPVLLVRYYQK
jgi:hypothetical protein